MEERLARVEERVEQNRKSIDGLRTENEIDHTRLEGKIDSVLINQQQQLGFMRGLKLSYRVISAIVIAIGAAIGWVVDHVYEVLGR